MTSTSKHKEINSELYRRLLAGDCDVRNSLIERLLPFVNSRVDVFLDSHPEYEHLRSDLSSGASLEVTKAISSLANRGMQLGDLESYLTRSIEWAAIQGVFEGGELLGPTLRRSDLFKTEDEKTRQPKPSLRKERFVRGKLRRAVVVDYGSPKLRAAATKLYRDICRGFRQAGEDLLELYAPLIQRLAEKMVNSGDAIGDPDYLAWQLKSRLHDLVHSWSRPHAHVRRPHSRCRKAIERARRMSLGLEVQEIWSRVDEWEVDDFETGDRQCEVEIVDELMACCKLDLERVIVAAMAAGNSCRETAADLDISKSEVHRVIQRVESRFQEKHLALGA
jgi:hypothetical protein